MQDIISIVVPIYNGEKYLDNCIQSLVNQTYERIEILLINDGSVDSSAQICHTWMQKDKRIKFFEHENMGQGPTETRGIHLAVGKYITFVDTDDWISEDFVEKMYQKAAGEDADICECCWCSYDDRSQQVTSIHKNDKVDKHCSYKYRAPHFWGRLYKTQMLVKNEIKLPSCPHQDLATYPIVALLANKICYVDEPLYYYRKNTGERISEKLGVKFYHGMVVEHLFKELERLGIRRESEAFLQDAIVFHLGCRIRKAKNYSEDAYQDILRKSIDVLNQNFKCWRDEYDKEYKVWGSFNASRIAQGLMLDFNINTENAPFYWKSSIISLMSQPISADLVSHPNALRKSMLQKECKKKFLDDICCTNSYVLIDFLEERYDIKEISKDTYVTYSDILDEGLKVQGRRIERASTECSELWYKSCNKFVKYLKENMDEEKIVLLELYLNEESIDYDGTVTRNDVSDMNAILRSYYEYFTEKMPNIHVIRVPEGLCYTDKNFEYGNYPYYYNDFAFCKLAQMVREVVV